ncbi:NADPH-dependent FMN reductase [Acholeplasma hippikon]|uniref:NADPH azoreductase n=1 Tax=Acholeplasma hippikon TaxID=264636 RepID=A0A449BID6_9MOLU|nr:NAD(P)H-dependent oxidoreductase [Acholeplasma hippikon]VEU82097.1 NADPH azoreductase [Acholeplasma hippikon]
MKIGIIIGTIREGRVGASVGKWVYDFAANRNDEGVTYELVDLKDYSLPLLGVAPTEQQGAAIGAWSAKMASFDGYVFVTGEYNRSIPGAFKNALDFLKPELANKPVGYVGYGGLGGTFAIAALRVSNAQQQLAGVRTMVNFSLMADFENFTVFKPQPYHAMNMNGMLDELLVWAKAFKTIR